MEVQAAPSFNSSAHPVSTTCRIVVSFDWSSTRYFLPDHLNSTNVVTDASGSPIQILDYYPYGSTRVNPQFGTTFNEGKQYIGRYQDPETNLNYLQARYYDGSKGEFLSEDPVFWGTPSKQDLQNPQDLNSYGYAADNPINRSDPSGLWYKEFLTGQQTWPSFQIELGQAAGQLSQDSPGWNYAFSHPVMTGAMVSIAAYPAAAAGGEAAAAYTMATFPGVGGAFAAQQGFAGMVYTALTIDSTMSVPSFANQCGQLDSRKPSSGLSLGWSLLTGPGTAAVGSYPGAFADAFQFAGVLNKTLGSAAINLFSNSVQTRVTTAQTFNSAIGSGRSGGGTPSANSLWVTPSGAVVTFGGQLVSPPSKK